MHTTPDYDSKRELPEPPEMWLNEIAYISNALQDLARNHKPLNILEWGSGNSTVYFASFLKQQGITFIWVAMEHFIPWHEKVVVMLEEKGLTANVEYYLKNK